MSNPTRPGVLPIWTQGNSGVRVQPTDGEQFTGFVPNFRPPSTWHNWLFGVFSDWIEWLDFISNPANTGEPPQTAAFAFAKPQSDYLCKVTSGSYAGTLPAASSVVGLSFLVKNISIGSGNSVIVTPQSGDSIEGGTAGATLSVGAGDVRRLTSDGVNGWWLTST